MAFRDSKIYGMTAEIYRYRTLLYSMVVRNLKGKYRNSALGFAWHFITPAISIILFYIVFTGLRATSIEDYWAYLCVGMFPFTFFQTNLSGGAGCIVANGAMIKKMYFPREIVVLSQVISTFITLLFAYVGVIILIVIAGMSVTSAILLLPVIMVLSVVFATGYVLLFSSINVFKRDVEHFIVAVSRVLFWITPIFYMASEVTGILADVIKYNPFAYFIEAYQDVLYFGIVPGATDLAVCTVLAIVALLIGGIVFSKLKGRFAEEL